MSPAIRDAFGKIEGCDVERIFLRRAFVMRTVPMCDRGPYMAAMRVALVEATSEAHIQRARGWKLFLFLPRCYSRDHLVEDWSAKRQTI